MASVTSVDEGTTSVIVVMSGVSRGVSEVTDGAFGTTKVERSGVIATSPCESSVVDERGVTGSEVLSVIGGVPSLLRGLTRFTSEAPSGGTNSSGGITNTGGGVRDGVSVGLLLIHD